MNPLQFQVPNAPTDGKGFLPRMHEFSCLVFWWSSCLAAAILISLDFFLGRTGILSLFSILLNIFAAAQCLHGWRKWRRLRLCCRRIEACLAVCHRAVQLGRQTQLECAWDQAQADLVRMTEL